MPFADSILCWLCALTERMYFDFLHGVLTGGGTVFFVHADGTPRYLGDEAEREEGGTPNVIGCIRYDAC
jgi:hypothetical protein